ncbi:MAG TPA: hypothetical protein VH561_08210 [Micromonosporaceae bacterium]|jgi:pimeloyl-ACP methyl ester carboxylesterase
MRKLWLLAALVISLAGCGRAPAPAPAAGAPCDDRSLQPIAFTNPSGDTLTGYLAGTGSTGVLLANGVDACSWRAYVHQLTDRGYRVLAFDYAEQTGGRGLVGEDVQAAAAYFRTVGAQGLVLIGASRGGAAVLAVASSIVPPVTAVVSLSGPAVYPGADAIAGVSTLSVPVLFVVGSQDTEFTGSAQMLYDATPGTQKKLVVIEGSAAHGQDLPLGGNSNSEANTAIFTFLDTYAKAA